MTVTKPITNVSPEKTKFSLYPKKQQLLLPPPKNFTAPDKGDPSSAQPLSEMVDTNK